MPGLGLWSDPVVRRVWGVSLTIIALANLALLALGADIFGRAAAAVVVVSMLVVAVAASLRGMLTPQR